ncbi:MAG: mechanosensitive ion channel family protein, partial [Pseudomonadota bacterium]
GGFAKYAILAVAIVAVLGQFGVQTASLLAVLGAAGLAIGLALQGTLSNVAAGVMLLILRPFNVGDYIEFAGNGGTIKAVGLFSTELATPDNVAIFAPNSAIWAAEVYNYSKHPIRRQDIAAGVSYSDDLDKALKTIESVLDKNAMILKTDGQKPEVMIENMGESSVDIKIRFWTKSEDYWAAKWEVTKSVKEALDKEGLTIPFPTRTVEVIGGDDDAAKAAA